MHSILSQKRGFCFRNLQENKLQKAPSQALEGLHNIQQL